ncbi:hypothetical protein JCM10213_000034 [Rhodosporidiobolus nylandii]
MHLEHPPPCPPSCTHCLAYDNLTSAICTRTPSDGSKWCPAHEELQAKLLKSYKRLTLAFDSFDDALLPPNLDAITSEQDLPQLRQWSEASRQKWSLSKRVIVARAEHHQQFYSGGDWGHCLFVSTLKTENERMERFLRALDRQAYKVTLAHSQASWVLDVPTGPSFICNDGPPSSAKPAPSTDGAPLTPPPTPPQAARELPSTRSPNSTSRKPAARKNGRQPSSSSASPPFAPTRDVEAENDAWFAALSPAPSSSSSTPLDLLKRLRDYLAPPPDLLPTVRPATWTSTIETLFRHVTLRIPSLATLALSSSLSSVPAFLDFLEKRLTDEEDTNGVAKDVERLWKALKFAKVTPDGEKEEEEDGLLGVGVLVQALDVVFRSVGEEKEHVELLGGKVWKTPQQAEWPREAWDLFYQFIACPGCSLLGTRSLAAWTTNRRLAALGHLPAWLGQGESPAERIFRLSGVILCTSNGCQAGRKVKRVEQKDVGKKGKGAKRKKTVYLEEWERGWMYVKLPADDRSLVILEHLASLPDRFSLLARNTATGEMLHSSADEPSCGSRRCSCCDDGVWLNKVRSGYTPLERKAARWTMTSYFPRDSTLSSLLKSSSPEARFHDQPFSDSYEAVILDATPFASRTHDDWSTFADGVAQAVLQALEADSVGELLWREKLAAVEREEMHEGEWETLHACAREQEPHEEVTGAKGRRGSKDEGARRRVLYVCEDDWTARKIFREE